MVEQVYENIYKIEVPLPQSPLKATNAYFIKGAERNLLVDSGFNRVECREALDAGLAELEVDLEQTDLFVTHLHSDHAGLSAHLGRAGNHLWMSAGDGESVRTTWDKDNWYGINTFIERSGILADGVDFKLEKHPGYRFAPPALPPLRFLEDGDIIDMGNFRWQAVSSPGHTPGQMCLYEPEHKLFLAGDHILDTITPNITIWFMELDSLGQYLDSLHKVDQLDIKLVLPGHRNLITDSHQRIAQLQQHHRDRLQDVLDILGDGRMNTAQVARRMRWDLSYKSWDEFPWSQKFFAAGEAMAHLRHLEEKGILRREEENEIFYYRKA